MLATYPQYSPQALMATPFGATLFAPPGLHAGNSFFGPEPGFAGFIQPSSPFAPTYGVPTAVPTPYPFLQTPYAPYAVAQQLVLALAQLAQQVSVHSVVTQQIGAALQQLTQQIQVHSLPGAAGFVMGQPYTPIGSPFIGSPFIGAAPGVQPAWQAWGGPRTQTIQ
jgi:hypothetical protein